MLKVKKIIILMLCMSNFLFAQNTDKDLSLYRVVQFFQRIFERSPEAIRISAISGASDTTNIDKDSSLYREVQFWQRIYEKTPEAIRVKIIGGVDSAIYADTAYYSYISTFLIDTTGDFVGVAEEGRLGLKTNTPTHLLDVNGSAKIRDTLFTSVIYGNSPLVMGDTIYIDGGDVGLDGEAQNIVLLAEGSGAMKTSLGFDTDISSNVALGTKITTERVSGAGLDGRLLFSTRNGGLTERMRIDEFGNIGIGTGTDVIDGKVHIKQPTPDDILNLYNGTSNLFTFTTGGELGINTETPQFKLDVRNLNAIQAGLGSDINQTIMKYNAGTNQDMQVQYKTSFFSSTEEGYQWLGESEIEFFNYEFVNNGTTNLITRKLDKNIGWGFYHSLTNSIVNSNIWNINVADSNDNYKMLFINSNGANLTGGSFVDTVMTLDGFDGGRVGINTSIPNSTFDVNGSIEAAYTISGTNYTALQSDQTIEMTNSGDTLFLPAGSGNKEFTIINTSAGNIYIKADGSETIGNTSPTATITVATGVPRGLIWNGTVWRVKI